MTKELRDPGAQLIVRGWLSANSIVFSEGPAGTRAVVDTGYVVHGSLTLDLVRHALGGRPLDLILNTHLHSDHCGGNRILQEAFPGARTSVPEGFRFAVHPWNEGELSFVDTGQQCDPFTVDLFVRPGDEVTLGSRTWQVHAAPGHDPEALMFFEPLSRTLVSGDALWEKRLAIIFPELAGSDGFGPAHRTLDEIERLRPNLVLPGHGGAFTDVAAALDQSRRKLDWFAAQPDRHRIHAARALAMFHMLEHRTMPRLELEAWMSSTPVFTKTFCEAANIPAGTRRPGEWQRMQAQSVVESLVADGALVAEGSDVRVSELS